MGNSPGCNIMDFVDSVKFILIKVRGGNKMDMKKKRTKCIKDVLDVIQLLVDNCTPKIIRTYFYGEYGDSPSELSIWYLFKTNDELKCAQHNNLINVYEEITRKMLIIKGYPKGVVLGDGKCVFIGFTSEQDIEETADGDYEKYFHGEKII